MTKYRLVPVALGVWAIILCAVWWEPAAIWLAAACGVVALGVVAAALRRKQVAVFALIPVVALVGLAHVASLAPQREALRAADASYVRVDVRVTSKVEPAWEGTWRLQGDAEGARGVAADGDTIAGPVVVLFSGARPNDLDLGAVIRVTARAERARTGEHAVLALHATASPEVLSPPPGLLAVAAELRAQFVALAQRFPGSGAQLLPGLSTGETSQVSQALGDDMKVTGLTHLVAVSGSNCAVIVGLAYFVLARVGARARLRAVGACVTLAAFVVLVTPEPSVIRAAIMSGIAMLALVTGRERAGLPILATSVILLISIDPWLTTSMGFALSVAATAALLTLARPLSHSLARFVPRPVAIALAVPLSAQLACAPLLILLSPTLSTWSVLANLIAAPAAPVATVAGLVACLLAQVPVISVVVASIAWVPAQWVATTAEVFATLPSATTPWVDGIAGALMLGAVCAAIIALLIGTQHRVVRLSSALVVAAAIGIAAGAVGMRTIVLPLTTPQDWSIAVCNVGQGDAIVVRSDDGVAVIDTGPDPVPLAACLDRLGIGRIALAVLTHFDADHVGGIDAIVGRAQEVIHGPPPPEAQRMLEDLRASGANVHEAHAGMQGMLGQASWRVLWPKGTLESGNDASVVLDVRGGGVPTSIFLGDLSADAQDQLLAARTLQPPYAVVKVAHHGSGDQSARLYERLAGALAVVPVGEGNTYGHPRVETLTLLDARGYTIARTDTSGLILLSHVADGSVRLWCERREASQRLRTRRRVRCVR